MQALRNSPLTTDNNERTELTLAPDTQRNQQNTTPAVGIPVIRLDTGNEEELERIAVLGYN